MGECSECIICDGVSCATASFRISSDMEWKAFGVVAGDPLAGNFNGELAVETCEEITGMHNGFETAEEKNGLMKRLLLFINSCWCCFSIVIEERGRSSYSGMRLSKMWFSKLKDLLFVMKAFLNAGLRNGDGDAETAPSESNKVSSLHSNWTASDVLF